MLSRGFTIWSRRCPSLPSALWGGGTQRGAKSRFDHRCCRTWKGFCMLPSLPSAPVRCSGMPSPRAQPRSIHSVWSNATGPQSPGLRRHRLPSQEAAIRGTGDGASVTHARPSSPRAYVGAARMRGPALWTCRSSLLCAPSESIPAPTAQERPQ